MLHVANESTLPNVLYSILLETTYSDLNVL